MALEILRDKDCTTQYLRNKTIGIIGFGAQGKAQAQNLKDSGYQVKIGLKPDSDSIIPAQEMGFEVCDLVSLAKECQMLVFLLPDEWHKEAFLQLSPYLQKDQILCFSHGFSVHFGEIVPPSFVDVILVAPKAAGHAVRSEYQKGRGVISLIGVAQDASGDAKSIALEYACALGSGKSAIFESSFKDECECDLFSEQSVICGGVDALIRAGFETLTEAGYPPEIAYFECLHEMKLVVDLIYANGIQSMRKHISNTAEYGDIIAGEQIITQESKKAMQKILQNIQSGEFAKQFLQERDKGFPTLKTKRDNLKHDEIEQVGERLRGLMPWLQK
ncbi:ketol-acid reductoisomerase [Helicobacter pametensis]|uniref:ketol-acid reductoisomerase n=1 Tax=Helicobacter pametensis TaxID=95149 RepID=UPI000489C0C0|nr:ketol-acid reductoisomerase [Helicobacter pametensis]